MALVVFTGGARSGKSRAAQRLAAARAANGALVSVAVFARDDGSDPEFADRVAKHRADRPAGWKTIEAHSAAGWLAHADDGDVLVVDCLGTMLGLAMEDAYAASVAADAALGEADPSVLPDGFEVALAARWDAALDALLARAGDTIVVTNEVGDGVVPAYAAGRLFRDLLGRANARLVAQADAAYLVVAGRLIDLAGAPTCVRWPED